MRQFTLIVASIIALVALLSACGTKGPLTLSNPAATAPATVPAVDPNTGAGQR